MPLQRPASGSGAVLSAPDRVEAMFAGFRCRRARDHRLPVWGRLALAPIALGHRRDARRMAAGGAFRPVDEGLARPGDEGLVDVPRPQLAR